MVLSLLPLLLLLLLASPQRFPAAAAFSPPASAAALSLGVFATLRASAALPSSTEGEGALMWSTDLREEAVLNVSSAALGWVDVPGSEVSFIVTRESLVMSTFTAVVVADKPYLPGGDFVSDTNADFVGMRLTVDGKPYRQSGAHTNALSSFEASRSTLVGSLIAEFGMGEHVVRLQWRRWGDFVRSWSVRAALNDGYGSGGTVVVRTHQKYLWYAQPLLGARLESAAAGWSDVEGMALSFSTPREWRYTVVYALPARPSNAPGSDVLAKADFVGARVTVNGKALRESGSLFRSRTRTFRSGLLAGSLTVTLPKGRHTVVLQWRKWGETVKTWLSQPEMHAGRPIHAPRGARRTHQPRRASARLAALWVRELALY